MVAPLLAVMRPLNEQLAYSDATIEHLAVQDPRAPRLRSVPCVGPVTAAAFLAAIDDAARFPHAHQLEAYLGLVPREYSSGDTQRRGPITKAGHLRVRWLLNKRPATFLAAMNIHGQCRSRGGRIAMQQAVRPPPGENRGCPEPHPVGQELPDSGVLIGSLRPSFLAISPPRANAGDQFVLVSFLLVHPNVP